jgi:RNA ligase (TIGR02306 family)
MSERKLASIRKISDIQPIEGADLIELAIVDGWKVVVGKEVGHKVGDFVIYCEVDSFLPIREEFEFLRKSSYRKMIDQEGFRLRTIKLRGCVSQGLIVPLSILEGDEEDEKLGYLQTPNGPIYQLGPYDGALAIEEGADVTNILGIVKWDPPIPACLSGVAKGNFPSWGRKTDQERAQNLVSEIDLELSKGSEFEISIKLDGTSMSVGKNGNDIVVCSRNLILDIDQEGNTLIDVAKFLGLLDRISEFGDIMISGELCGPGIQGNREKLENHKFFVFDIFDVKSGKYIGSEERIKIVESLGLAHVPIIHKSIKLNEIELNSLDDILAYANGESLNSKIREGLVFKKTDGSFSFKAISNEFLLKFE